MLQDSFVFLHVNYNVGEQSDVNCMPSARSFGDLSIPLSLYESLSKSIDIRNILSTGLLRMGNTSPKILESSRLSGL